MALDINALRSLGFSRRQAQALAPALQSTGGGTINALPPYVPVPAGSKVHEFVSGESLGNADWDHWFGGDANSSGHVHGTFTAIRNETITLPGPVFVPGHEGTWPTSSLITVAPLDLPAVDWISAGDPAAVNATYLAPGEEAQYSLTAGRTYVVLFYEYDTVDATSPIRIDYTDFWNAFAAHMLPSGEMCTVFDTGTELYLIPDPLVVRPAPQSIRAFMMTDTVTFGAVNLDGYRSKNTGNQLADTGNQLVNVGASWNATDDRYDLAGRQQWTLHIKLNFTNWTTPPDNTHWAKMTFDFGGDSSEVAFTRDNTRRTWYGGSVFFNSPDHLKIYYSTNHPDAQMNVLVHAQVVA